MNNNEQRVLRVEGQFAGTRLDVFLAEVLEDFSRSRVHRLIESGSVVVNGKAAKPKYPVAENDVITIDIPPPEAAAPLPQDIPLEVVYEDDDLLVLDKPAGLVVHPGAGVPDGTVVNALVARLGELSVIGGVMRPGIVHRLDKDTSGLMIVAKNDVAHRKLSESLARREISRVYRAIALRSFPEKFGTIEEPIGRHPTVRTKMAVCPGGRAAKTAWRVIEEFAGFTLVECRLFSGRTHQIRVHLAHIKHPVLGDALYGGTTPVALQLAPPGSQVLRNCLRRISRQMLHAHELTFAHPGSGEQLHFTSALPKDFAGMLEILRKEAKR